MVQRKINGIVEIPLFQHSNKGAYSVRWTRKNWLRIARFSKGR